MGRQSMMDLCQDILTLCGSIQADLAALRAQRRKVAYLQSKDAEASSPVLQVHEDLLEILPDVAKLFVEDDSSDLAVACDKVPSELQVASQDKRTEGGVAAASVASKSDLGIAAGMVSELGIGVMFMRLLAKPPYDFSPELDIIPSSVNRLSYDNCDFAVDAVKVLPMVNLLRNHIGNFDKPQLLRMLFGIHEWFDPGGRIHNKEEVTSNDKCKRFPAEIEDVITENLRRGEGSVKPENLQSLVSFEKIFEKLEDGACNCTVATNVAEISLTIDGIFYVIDFEDGKMEVYKASVGMDALQMFLVSKVAVDQRTGCVCRTGPSTCYWLHTGSVCAKELLPSTVMEIQQTNLGQENIRNSMYQLEGVGSGGSLIRSWELGKRLANLKGTTNGFNGYIEIGRGRYGFVYMILLPGVTPLNNHIESYFHMVFRAYILQGCGLIERYASSFCLLLNELGMVRDVVEWQSVPQKFGVKFDTENSGLRSMNVLCQIEIEVVVTFEQDDAADEETYDEDEKKVILLVHDTKPLILDRRFFLTKQTESVKDPRTDMVIIASKGSALVSEGRTKQSSNKSRQHFWELAGSKFGDILGVKKGGGQIVVDTAVVDDDDEIDFEEEAKFSRHWKKGETVSRESQVNIMVGETGSRKTTPLNKYLHEDAYTTNSIMGSPKPRRMAAISTDVLFQILKGVVAQCWDCKFIVTLATLSAKKFSDLLGSVSISNSVGRTFPLNILYSKTSCENYVGAAKQDTTIHITGKEKIEVACCYIAERMEQLVSSAKTVLDLFQLPADEQAIHRLTARGRMIHLGDQLIELSDGDTKVMETFSASKLLWAIEIEVNESCAIDMVIFSGGEKPLVVVMFSQPRPPDNLNLEDKVSFEGGWDDKPSDIFLVPLEDHDKGMASGTLMAEHQGELCDIGCSMGYFSCVFCYVV